MILILMILKMIFYYCANEILNEWKNSFLNNNKNK